MAGFGAGTVATLVMHPLDLVKVRFQLATIPSGMRTAAQPVASTSAVGAAAAAASGSGSAANVIPSTKARLGTGVYLALRDAVRLDGWSGLYRGLVPNLVGGAGSWGLYFLLCVRKETLKDMRAD